MAERRETRDQRMAMSDRKFGYNEYGVLEWLAPNPDVRAGQTGDVEQTDFRLRFDNGSQSTADWIAPTGEVPAVSMQGLDDAGATTIGHTSSQKVAIQFTTGGAASVTDVMLRLSAIGGPTDNLQAQIFTNNSGEPSTTQVGGTASIASSDLSSTIALYHLTFASAASLSASTTYWLVLSRSGTLSSTNYYQSAASNTSFTSVYHNGTSWGSTTGDIYHILLASGHRLSPEVGYRVRFLLTETGGKNASAGTAAIQYRVDAGSGFSSWALTGSAVTPTGESSAVYVSYYTGSKESDNTTTSQQLGSGSFTAGRYKEGYSTASIAIAAGGETEHEFTFYIDSACLDGWVVELRAIYQDGSTVLESYAAGSTPTIVVGDYRLEQQGFRFRNDDGSESAATWIAALNTDATLDLDTNYRIRFLVELTQGYRNSGPAMQLYYRKNSGSWLLAGGGGFNYALSTYFAENDDTVQRLGTGPFVSDNNGMSEGTATKGYYPNDGGANRQSGPGYEIEYEICFTIDSANFSASDTIDLRLEEERIPLDGYNSQYDANGTDLYAYNQTPTITVASGTGLDLVKVLDEDLDIDEVIVKLKNIFKVIAETEDVDEVLVKPMILNRILDEEQDVDETVIRAGFLYKIIDEVLDFVEDAFNIRGLAKVVDEVVDFVETNLHTKSIFQILSEVENVDETTYYPRSLNRIGTDVLRSVEDIVRSQNIIRLLVETVDIQEVVVKTKLIVQAVAEVLDIDEVALNIRGLAQAVSEVLDIDEVVVHTKLIAQIIDEVEDIQEALVRSMNIVRIRAEVLDFIESTIYSLVTPGLDLVKVLSEVLDIQGDTDYTAYITAVVGEWMEPQEGIVYKLVTAGQALVEVLSEVIDSVEALVVTRALTRVRSEVENVDEVVVETKSIFKLITEVLNINEVRVKARQLSKIISETFHIEELVLRLLALTRITDEEVNIDEVIVRYKIIVQAVSEVLDIAEDTVYLVVGELVRLISEALNISESLTRSIVLVRIKGETLNLVESILRIRDIVRISGETLSVVEQVVKNLITVILAKVINEAMSLVERVQISRHIIRIILERIGPFERIVRWFWSRIPGAEDGWTPVPGGDGPWTPDPSPGDGWTPASGNSGTWTPDTPDGEW